eukprot:CAMPEP_0179051174 /NCGR_PEP_ID=MMETSP0796-20121207/21110_1 /TAXON_ID=73915 /ORGANISM="Pyrodinium bahamense, Strain pbaha01" /LENGTH=229 /DNA_ID=CAMNT_0020747709 /DNA_START=48 /DNA_END=737 /DNA_ORIENTATION=+
MFGLSACNTCGCGGSRQTDTVKVSFSPPADLCDKENEAPCLVISKEAELQDAATEEQRCLEQEEEDERRAREKEEEREKVEADRQRQRELARLQALERQRLEELERQRRLQEEQRSREEEELRQQEVEEAHCRAEEARKQQQRLSIFLSKHGFTGANEKKKIKSGMISSASAYPLHVAVRAADAQAVGLLLWAGADKTLQDSAKRTPLALAQKLNKNGSHEHVIDTLAG